MQEYFQQNSDILLPLITYMDWNSIRLLMNTSKYMYSLKDNKALLDHISNSRLLPYVSEYRDYEQYVNLTYTEIYKIALVKGDIRLVKNLSCIIEKKLTYITNAVEIATINRHYDIVTYLVENGHEILDSLYYATKNGDKRIFDYLLSKGAKIGKYDIEEAIIDKQPEMAKYIFVKKRVISNYAVTYATYLGYNELAKFLHKNGGNIGLALEVATKNGNDYLVKYFVKYTEYRTIQQEDDVLNADEIMRFFIENPFSFDGMRNKNENFLNYSFDYTHKDSYDLVRFTVYMMKLSGNIDMINFVDSRGIIPAATAFTRNNLDIAKLFVRNGANGICIDNIRRYKIHIDIKRYLYSSYIGEISYEPKEEDIEVMKQLSNVGNLKLLWDVFHYECQKSAILILIIILKLPGYRYNEENGIYSFIVDGEQYKEFVNHIKQYLSYF